MRKIILQKMISLDGYFEGPNGELDWHIVDDEFNEYAIELVDSVDLILFGRVAYQLFESYWPAAAKDPATSKHDLKIADQFDKMNKIVFSRTLKEVKWENSKLVREFVPGEILKMKQQPGKHIAITGANLANSFIQHNLVDEYRIIVSPVILGKGRPLFKELDERLNLKLTQSRTFKSGNVLLYYEPVRK